MPSIFSPFFGSVKRNVAPPSVLFSAEIVPLWAEIMDLQIESPIPSPRVESPVFSTDTPSNICSISYGFKPTPLSFIEKTTSFSV